MPDEPTEHRVKVLICLDDCRLSWGQLSEELHSLKVGKAAGELYAMAKMGGERATLLLPDDLAKRVEIQFGVVSVGALGLQDAHFNDDDPAPAIDVIKLGMAQLAQLRPELIAAWDIARYFEPPPEAERVQIRP